MHYSAAFREILETKQLQILLKTRKINTYWEQPEPPQTQLRLRLSTLGHLEIAIHVRLFWYVVAGMCLLAEW